MQSSFRLDEWDDPGLQAALQTFTYLAEHRLLICRKHGYAVNSLRGHLTLYYPRSRDERGEGARRSSRSS